MGKKKDKKEKVVYIDDGRTIADMSGISGGNNYTPRLPGQPRPSFKEVWSTYWSAVKMMFTPMLVVIVGLGVVYMLLYLLFWLM